MIFATSKLKVFKCLFNIGEEKVNTVHASAGSVILQFFLIWQYCHPLTWRSSPSSNCFPDASASESK